MFMFTLIPSEKNCPPAPFLQVNSLFTQLSEYTFHLRKHSYKNTSCLMIYGYIECTALPS